MAKFTLDQNCAETMIIKAAELLGDGMTICFDYKEEELKDKGQIDIFPAFIHCPSETRKILFGGYSEATLLEDINTLDKSKLYFVRSGKVGGAGHYRLLYQENNCWIMYSSPSNFYNLTTEQDKLVNDLVVAKGKWGDRQGEYCIMLQEASIDTLKLAANFAYDIRTKGETEAMEILEATQHPSFYPQIIDLHKISQIKHALNQCLPIYEKLRFVKESSRRYRCRDIFHWGYSFDEKRAAFNVLKTILETGEGELTPHHIKVLRNGRLGKHIRLKARSLAKLHDDPSIATVRGLLAYILKNRANLKTYDLRSRLR